MKTLTKMLAVAACALAPLQARGAWEVVPNVPTGVDLHDVAVGGVGNVVVAVGDGGTIVRSDDLGATWSIVSCPTTQDLISLNNGGSHLRAGGAGGDSPQSFDGGVTWQFFGTNPPGTSPEIFSKATSVAFVATAEGGLYRTTNAGVSWQEQISPTGVPFHAGAGTTGSPGLVVGDQGTIWHTTNGVDWAPVTSGTDVALRDCEGPNVYSIVVGDGGTILTSDQNAISWTPRSSGTTANLNAFDRFGDAHAIVVGDGGVILWSTDSGETWCALPSGTTANLRGVAFVGAEAVAVGDGGTILRHTGTFGPCDAPGSIFDGFGDDSADPASAAAARPALRLSPNPAVAGAAVTLEMRENCLVRRLEVFDASGRAVSIPEERGPRDSSVRLQTRALPAGMYWVRVESDRFAAQQRLLVIR